MKKRYLNSRKYKYKMRIRAIKKELYDAILSNAKRFIDAPGMSMEEMINTSIENYRKFALSQGAVSVDVIKMDVKTGECEVSVGWPINAIRFDNIVIKK